MQPRGEQSETRQVSQAKLTPSLHRSLWFGGFGFVGVWALGLIDILERNQGAFLRTLGVALVVAAVLGVSAALIPMGWGFLVRWALIPLLGQSVEEPLSRVASHPLSRALALVFALVGFGALFYAAWFSHRGVGGSLAFAAEKGFVAAAGLLAAVIIWRLATRS